MSSLAKLSCSFGAKHINILRNVACYQHQQERTKSNFDKYFGSAPRAPEGTNREWKCGLKIKLLLNNVCLFVLRPFLEQVSTPCCADG